MVKMRIRLYHQLDPLAWTGVGMSPLNKSILALIMLSVLAAVLESEPSLYQAAPNLFGGLNIFFAVMFSVEFGFRAWSMGENPAYSGLAGRLRFALRYASLIDIVATVALWADIILGVPGVYGVLLRMVRVLRAITLTRNSQWAKAILLLRNAIFDRRLELTLSFGFAGIILLVSATLLFIVEGHTQPEAFGSIPRAMWWAMVTLTTVGYGDVYPLTALGQFFAAIVALTAIAIVAMPTGIMAAAFSDAFQNLNENS